MLLLFINSTQLDMQIIVGFYIFL